MSDHHTQQHITEHEKHSPAREKAPPDTDMADIIRERDEYLHGWKRALADYENYKNDQTQRSADLQIYQLIEFFRELLPLFDTLSQTIQHVPPEQRNTGWYRGLEALQGQWKQFMTSHGVQVIPGIDTHFDPTFHEAIATENHPDEPDGVITTVASEGYLLNDRTVIRPAKVIVNKLT